MTRDQDETKAMLAEAFESYNIDADLDKLAQAVLDFFEPEVTVLDLSPDLRDAVVAEAMAIHKARETR